MIGVIPIFIKDKDRLDLITTKLNGKSIVAYCIESALASKRLEKVFGFTNNDMVSKIFEEYSIHFSRITPDESVEDSALLPYGSISSCLSLNKVGDEDHPDLAIIGHRNPFLNGDVIDSAISKFQSNGTDVLLSVKKAEPHPALLTSMQDQFIKSSMINLIKKDSDIKMINGDMISVVYPEETPLLKYGSTYYCICQAFFPSGSSISSGWIKFTMPCSPDDNLKSYNIEEGIGIKTIKEEGDIPLTITFSEEQPMHPTFSWKPVPNAVDYKLFISDPSMELNGNMTAKKRFDNAINTDEIAVGYPEEAPPLRYCETYRCMVQAYAPPISTTISSGYVEFATPCNLDDDPKSYSIRGCTGVGMAGDLSISVSFLKESPLQPIFSWNPLPNAISYDLIINVPSPDLMADMMDHYVAKDYWRYDLGTGRRINALTGEVITGRQQLPQLFEPNNAIFILKGKSLKNFDEVVSRGNAASFIMDMPEGLEIKGKIDILRARVMERIRTDCIISQ